MKAVNPFSSPLQGEEREITLSVIDKDLVAKGASASCHCFSEREKNLHAAQKISWNTAQIFWDTHHTAGWKADNKQREKGWPLWLASICQRPSWRWKRSAEVFMGIFAGPFWPWSWYCFFWIVWWRQRRCALRIHSVTKISYILYHIWVVETPNATSRIEGFVLLVVTVAYVHTIQYKCMTLWAFFRFNQLTHQPQQNHLKLCTLLVHETLTALYNPTSMKCTKCIMRGACRAAWVSPGPNI